MGLNLVMDEEHVAWLKETFDGPLMTSNLKQAAIMEGGFPLRNPKGTALGVYVEKNGKAVALLPGPPKEVLPMLHNELKPHLEKYSGEKLLSKTLCFTGIGESDLELRVKPLIDGQENPTIAPLVKDQFVSLRVTAKTEKEAKNLIEDTENKIREIVGAYVMLSTYEEIDFDLYVGDLLLKSGTSIALAESITAGGISSALVKTKGISKAMKEAIVCYTNESKVARVGIDQDLVDRYGAVSEEVTTALAKKIKSEAKTDLGFAITGYADGDFAGRIHVAIDGNKGLRTKEFSTGGDRGHILGRAKFYGLNFLREYLT